MVQLLKESLAEEKRDYFRSLCGGMSEQSSSTIETPDIDINEIWHLNSDFIKITVAESFGPMHDPIQDFFYEIEVVETKKKEVDELLLKMQYHGMDDTVQQNWKPEEKLMAKSFLDLHHPLLRFDGRTLISSNVAMWQMMGMVRAMQAWNLVDADPNEGYSLFDSEVCMRGTLERGRLEKVMLENKPYAERATLQEMMDLVLPFFPKTGIQVDYTTGFHVSGDALPAEATEWTRRDGEWPSRDLINKVLAKGALLVPKTNLSGQFKEYVRTRWRMDFDLNMIITDKEYSPNVDANRVLIILKDIKNAILPGRMVKTYFLKVAIAR